MQGTKTDGFGTDRVRRKMPSYFYSKEEVELMLQLDSRGFSHDQICEALWYELPQLYDPTHWRSSKGKVRKRVTSILADQDHWNPHEDQSLIQRAYDGDREAYDSLTFYELRTLSQMLYERSERESLTGWCELVDESSGALYTRFSKQREREEQNYEPRPIRKKTDEATKKAIIEAYNSRTNPNITGIGREFGVSRETVYRVLGRRTD